MDNKKALRMAVTLAIINMPLLAQAADVSPVRITDGSTYTMTADSVINTGSNMVSLPPVCAVYCRSSRRPLVKAAYLPFSEVAKQYSL